MNWLKLSLKYPAAIAVIVMLVLLSGSVAVNKLPVQLFPTITRPVIELTTYWGGASSPEVETEIIRTQEAALETTRGLRRMTAVAKNGRAEISLEFDFSVDMTRTMLDVIGRLGQTDPLPPDAKGPIISLGSNEGNVLTYYFVQKTPDNPHSVYEYGDLITNTVKPRLESLKGVSRVRVRAGPPKQLQVRFDPADLVNRGISIETFLSALRDIEPVSAGNINLGSRDYRLRMPGSMSVEALNQQIVTMVSGQPVRLGEITDIQIVPDNRNGFSYQNGNQAISIRIDRDPSANMLETIDLVRQTLSEIESDILTPRQLKVAQSFDPSVFVYRAIKLVSGNLIIGILLAVGILWWFLRQFRATLLIAMAIPICLFATFDVLWLADRSLNVISIAGLAFAVGMVLDAAIVVLENIVRLKEMQQSGRAAAFNGAKQVWPALLASTATTVAIFLPVIFIKDVEGQIFSDLAFTIAVAVCLSLFVAVIVLPTAAYVWIRNRKAQNPQVHVHAKRLAAYITQLTDNQKKRIAMICGLTFLPLLLSILLLPQMDYLPPVKRDAVDVWFRQPPGLSPMWIESEVVPVVKERLQPLMTGEREPALRNYYFIGWSGGTMLGIRAKDQSRVEELVKIVREEVVHDIASMPAQTGQGTMFGGFESGRSIEILLQAGDIEALAPVALMVEDKIKDIWPDAYIRSTPDLSAWQPSIEVHPNFTRLSELQLSTRTLTQFIQMMGSGYYFGKYFTGEKAIQMRVRSAKEMSFDDIVAAPLVTQSGGHVSIGEVATLKQTGEAPQIFRIDSARTLMIRFYPQSEISMEAVLDVVKSELVPNIQKALPEGAKYRISGEADKLAKAVMQFAEQFAMALIVLFLLLAALFQSVRDSIYVMLTLPLATVGGVLALHILNWIRFQPLDLLTMIGFIILLGLVVNNAILLVHQTRVQERHGMLRRDAVKNAIEMRLRPIAMSTLTTLFGMLPLLLVPGQGSVMYQGLAAVIVGGLSLSTLFTLLLLPAYLRLGEKS